MRLAQGACTRYPEKRKVGVMKCRIDIICKEMFTSKVHEVKTPYNFRTYLSVLHAACVGLIDKNATIEEGEEMFAVMAGEDAVTVAALLIVGMARHARALAFSSEEGARRVMLHVRGKRRVGGAPLSEEMLLPAAEGATRLLVQLARESDITYRFCDDGETVALSLSFPRFLIANYDVCAIDPKHACDLFFKVMLLMAEGS